MESTSRIVSPLELAQALLDNGDCLLSDAAYLLHDGRRARAAALSLMASEEFSKLHHCLDAITGEADLPSARSNAWRGHREKLETARALELAFIDAEPNLDQDRARAEVESLMELKMACIYVDHDRGEIRHPGDAEVDVEALISRGRATSALLHTVFDPITPDVIVGIDEHRELLKGLITALIDEDDPESTIRRLRALAAAAVANDPEALQTALVSALEGSLPVSEPSPR